MRSATAMTKIATVLGAAVLVLGIAACGEDDSEPAPVTVTEEVGAEGTTEHREAEGSRQAGGDGAGSLGPEVVDAIPVVRLDGEDVAGDFSNGRCDWGEDDGHPELEFDAGRDIELEVELVLSDPPRLDDLSLEADGDEWEAEDGDRRNAQISVDQDTYRILSPVTEDDSSRKGELDVTFQCPGR